MFLQVAPERTMYEAVRVKPMLLWGPKVSGDARNMKHLPRKVTGNKWSQPEREAIGQGYPNL
jgi:hypothetical protein